MLPLFKKFVEIRNANSPGMVYLTLPNVDELSNTFKFHSEKFSH